MAKSILQSDMTTCYICGKFITGKPDPHHIYNGGGLRDKSDEDGLVVYVHRTCHTWLHNHPKSNWNIKARVQKIWQEYYGKNEEDFIKRYGKNYIGEINEKNTD